MGTIRDVAYNLTLIYLARNSAAVGEFLECVRRLEDQVGVPIRMTAHEIELFYGMWH